MGRWGEGESVREFGSVGVLEAGAVCEFICNLIPGSAQVVHLENLYKRREQAGSVFELFVPELKIAPGRIMALVGDSGCGKSTLLDMLALVMQPTSADSFVLRFEGEKGGDFDVQALWSENAEYRLAQLRREHMGYILQTGGLLSFLTVLDNVRLPARIKGLDGYFERLRTLAARLGIEHCLERKPDYLSIGQRQRVAILRALAHGPDLVLADEPTAAVDKARARLIMQDLREVTREQNTAVVLVTHDTDLAKDVDATYSFDLEHARQGVVQAFCRQVS